ncbi:glycosyltransferase family 2 protein [Aegicerativicinus sediminis]
MTISVIIPAYNEEASIGKVVKDIPNMVEEVIVINNNSSDNTSIVAKQAGAIVLDEPNPGYGNACLKGMDYLAKQSKKPDIVVFLDGDYSDYPEDLVSLINPIVEKDMDFVIGARNSRLRENGSMTPQQIFGNWLATTLMRIFYGAKFTDLGPFRSIKYEKLLELGMEDKNYGWTVEMQLKALRHNLSYIEIPVRYRNRIGISKVSGTLKGSVLAGIKIIGWIIKYGLKK